MDDPILNAQLVGHLRDALTSGESGFRRVPTLIKEVIYRNAWHERRNVKVASFLDFVTKPPPDGLETTVDILLRLCQDDPEAIDLIDQCVTNPHGIHHDVDNINITGRPNGTSRQQALRRLRRDAPELHARVLARELSANAAMIEAGFRDPTITIPRPVPKAARRLRGIYSPDEILDLIAALAEEEHA